MTSFFKIVWLCFIFGAYWTVFILWYDRTTFVVRKFEEEKMWYPGYHIFLWYHKGPKIFWSHETYHIFSGSQRTTIFKFWQFVSQRLSLRAQGNIVFKLWRFFFYKKTVTAYTALIFGAPCQFLFWSRSCQNFCLPLNNAACERGFPYLT